MDTRRWNQVGAASGIIYVILQVVGQLLVQVGGSEPSFGAAAPEIVAFFMARDSRLFGIGDYLSIVSLVPFIWFTANLWGRLRKAEGDLAWLSVAMLGCGLVASTTFLNASWTLALGRINTGLDPEIVQLLFDQGNFLFANSWVALAGMLLAAGVVSVRTQALPVWLGWAGVLIAAGLVVARAFWVVSGLVFVPYVLYWLWLVVVSIILIRGADDS